MRAGDKPYDALVLACGARNRLLPVPRRSRRRLYLRTLDESRAVKQRLQAQTIS